MTNQIEIFSKEVNSYEDHLSELNEAIEESKNKYTQLEEKYKTDMNECNVYIIII